MGIHPTLLVRALLRMAAVEMKHGRSLWTYAVTEPNGSTKTIEDTKGNMVEAGGVEPPSEKRYARKPTCLAQFGCFRLPRLERARNADG